MSAMKVFTDEDVYAVVATAVRNAGFDAVSTPEVGRLAESDEAQLDWATLKGRVLVTFNVSHFAALHADRLSQGLHHAGIVVSAQRPIGDLLRRLLHLLGTLDAEAMHDRLEFLGDW